MLRGRDHVTGGMGYKIGSRLSEETKPILHCGDTRDSTSVITEEDTTETGKGAKKIGLEGDRGFDQVDIGRGENGANSSTRHDYGMLAKARLDVPRG